ncbi:MAG: chorismate synthase, partial [Rhodospirillaceae bacterium]|nr:chorismate synthase [Rhodospirillaceae bacterium]
DPRGGGRASARETACRVAAGAVARKVLGPDITIRGALRQVGEHRVSDMDWDWDAVGDNIFHCPDPAMAVVWEDYLDGIRKAGSSVGAVVEIHASGVPAGWGAPVYGKLDGDLAAGMMSINAVKGVEIGAGFGAAGLRGEDAADEMLPGNDGPGFSANHNGGVLGGISSGQDIIVRFVVKATSSILIPRRSIDTAGGATEVVTKGRHDPCVGIRAVPVGEAMMACILADQMLRHRAQMG